MPPARGHNATMAMNDLLAFSDFWPANEKDRDVVFLSAGDLRHNSFGQVAGGVLCDLMLSVVGQVLVDHARDKSHLLQLFKEARERLDDWVDAAYKATEMAAQAPETNAHQRHPQKQSSDFPVFHGVATTHRVA